MRIFDELPPVLRELRERRESVHVAVIGDVMIDEYLRGDVSRISPEAPVPILEVRTLDQRLGGAANAAANLRALGARATLIGVVGRDDTAEVLARQLAERQIANATVADGSRPTSKKTRLVAQQQQIVRIDREVRIPVSGEVEVTLGDAIETIVGTAHAVVVSDYAKGVVTDTLARRTIDVARAKGIPVIVDPKQRDFTRYRGATVLTPNLHELELATPSVHGFEIERAAEILLPSLGGAALLVTRSADGMTLFRAGREPFHMAALAREVFDVTGAGDTVVAALALGLAVGLRIENAVRLASLAAAISVTKRGTATVSLDELVSTVDDLAR